MTPTYGCVVLAAGKNTRLKGLVPSAFKPLMIVNGRPLIVNIVRHAYTLFGQAVVVASPQNCATIAELLEDNGLMDRTQLVVQPSALGPGEALYRALYAERNERVMLICGDNIVPFQDYVTALESDRSVCDKWGAGLRQRVVTVSTALTDDEVESSRFTRVDYTGENRLTFIENRSGGRWPDGKFRYWVGPLVFDRNKAFVALYEKLKLKRAGEPGELKISGPLADIHEVEIVPVTGTSVDVGTSDALVQLENNVG